MQFSEKTFEIYKTNPNIRNDYVWYTSDQHPDMRLTVIYSCKKIWNAVMNYDTEKVVASVSVELRPDRESPENIQFIYRDEIFEGEQEAVRKVKEIEEEVRAKLEELILQSNNGEYDYEQVG